MALGGAGGDTALRPPKCTCSSVRGRRGSRPCLVHNLEEIFQIIAELGRTELGTQGNRSRIQAPVLMQTAYCRGLL